MKTLVLEPAPLAFVEFLEGRRRLGQDLYDEVWEGTYHMAPVMPDRHADFDQQVAELLGHLARARDLMGRGPFNLGGPDDYWVPDRGLLHVIPDPDGVYLPTAAMVVEILSPGDETLEKLPFYAAHAVDEVLIIDPDGHVLRLLVRADERYEEAEYSTLLVSPRPNSNARSAGVDSSSQPEAGRLEYMSAIRWAVGGATNQRAVGPRSLVDRR